jgi:hypothetical protein
MRERRARGTRAALNWNDNFRLWLTAAFGLLFLSFGLIELITSSVTWQRVCGVVVAAACLLLVAFLVRWLLRPVDPESLDRLRTTRESSRLISRRTKDALTRRDE